MLYLQLYVKIFIVASCIPVSYIVSVLHLFYSDLFHIPVSGTHGIHVLFIATEAVTRQSVS